MKHRANVSTKSNQKSIFSKKQSNILAEVKEAILTSEEVKKALSSKMPHNLVELKERIVTPEEVKAALSSKTHLNSSKNTTPRLSLDNFQEIPPKISPSHSQIDISATNHSTPQLSSTAKTSPGLKIQTMTNFLQGDASPKEVNSCSLASTPRVLLRKDSRSQTEVNTPITPMEFTNFKAATEGVQNSSGEKFVRTAGRTSTELTKSSKGTYKRSVFLKSSSSSRHGNGFSNNTLKNSSSVSKLAYNYKLESTPARVLQKENHIENPYGTNDIIVEEVHYNKINEKNLTREPELAYVPEWKSFNTKSQINSISKHRRTSLASNPSVNSLTFVEQNQDILFELTRSVQELNMRLMKNEQVANARLSENQSLKNTIRTLENKIESQKSTKLDQEGVHVGCTNSCLLF